MQDGLFKVLSVSSDIVLKEMGNANERISHNSALPATWFLSEVVLDTEKPFSTRSVAQENYRPNRPSIQAHTTKGISDLPILSESLAQPDLSGRNELLSTPNSTTSLARI